MIYVGDKKATPYYEDYKPVNVYRNHVKIAGWRVDEKSGTSLEWADTYNDKVVSAVVPGASTQAATVQGKNLLDATKRIDGYLTVDGTTAGSAAWVVFDYVRISPNTTYTLSRLTSSVWANIILYDVSKQITSVRNNSPTCVLTTGANDYFIRFSSRTDNALWPPQLELGSTATPYEPFTPDSPSPDYPSPIISTGEASGIDLTVTGNAGQSYSAHRDIILRGLPDGTHDTWDVVTGTVTRNVGVKVFDGAETSWIAGGAAANRYRYYISDSSSPFPAAIVGDTGLCDQYSLIPWETTLNNRPLNSICIRPGGGVQVMVSEATLAEFLAKLSANPVTVLYKLATPTAEQTDPEALPTYPRYTMLNCNAEVTARVRVIEHGL